MSRKKIEEDNDNDSDNESIEESSQNQMYDDMIKQTSTFNLNDSKEDISVFIEFTGGYTFRQLVEFNKKAVLSMPIFCNKDKIYTYRANGKKTLVTYTVAERKNLTKYIFNEKNINCPSDKYHIISLKLDEFHSQIKSLGKKEGLRIYQIKSKPEFAWIQFFGGKTEGGWIQVRTEKYEPNIYNVDERNPRSTDNPNVTIPLSSFCSAITSNARLKYPHVTIRSYEDGAELFSSNETGTTIKRTPWGNVNPIFDEHNKFKPINCFEINIALSELTALSKTSNFHNEGIVRLYCSNNNILRFEIPLGCYATSFIYIIDPGKI